jgi:hypothetical protein
VPDGRDERLRIVLEAALRNTCRSLPRQQDRRCLYLSLYCGIGTANLQHDDHSPVEEAQMRRELAHKMTTVMHTQKRVAVAAATMVAMIATVGAPFKWSMSWVPIVGDLL